MSALDLGPATRATAAVLAGVADDQLGHPTPCPDWSVGDLVDHVGGLAVAFAAAARKDALAHAPTADGRLLEAGWRDRVTAALEELAAAWREPGALEGFTMAGPIEMPAEVALLVAVDEVVVHGWDLAVATGQAYDPDPACVAAARGFAESFTPPDDAGPADDSSGGLFGPPVAVPPDAPALHHLLGAAGRDPAWTPTSR